jgi:tetratricopeptide (TPR) repeat protein
MLKRNQQRGVARVSVRGAKTGRPRRGAQKVRAGTGLRRHARNRSGRSVATKAAHIGLPSGRLQSASAPRPTVDQAALRDFEAGVRYFQKKNYQKAAETFEKLVRYPAHEVADRARLHLRLCRQRMGREAPAPRTAEEHYLLGIAALNSRQLSVAVEYLSKADKLQPDREHVQYALGAACALQGETERALKHLQAAIRLRPGNRTLARSDADFQALFGEPRFRQLLAGGAL